jgi:uncharacterized protein (TIGR02147 family)
MNIYLQTEPVAAIQAYIDENHAIGKIKTRLAAAAKCKQSYFSNVLGGKVNLTVDQAFGISKFMGLTDIETEYFLLLVQLARAGDPDLKSFLKNRIKIMRQSEFKLEKKFLKKDRLSPAQVRVYYSSWHHQSIHMLLTIPKYGRVENIAKRLNLPVETALSKLKTLESIGLAEKVGEYWRSILKDIHIPIHDPSSLGHQIQWKLQAISDLQNPRTEGLHYSSVYSLSFEDFQKLKSMMVSFIEETRVQVEKSREEDIAHFQLSFFQV